MAESFLKVEFYVRMKWFFAFITGLFVLFVAGSGEVMASELVGEIKQLVPEMEIGVFEGRHGVGIVYGVREVEAEKGAVVIVNGRNETFVKYRQVIDELIAAGFSVYTFDHRGQGFSGRQLADPHKGHVDSFDDYVADFHFFLEHVVNRRPYDYCLALAHSMGGTITLLHELRYPGSFTGIVMTAPMLGFSTAPWPAFLVPPILSVFDALGQSQSYIIGGGPFEPKPFSDDNPLTSDCDNYTRNQQLMIEYPQIQLGAPTNAWVKQALVAIDEIWVSQAQVAIEEIMAGAESLRSPLLILQAGADQVVDNRAQERFFCNRAGNCELQIIPEARHEILVESPELREMAVKAMLDFFERVCGD